MKAGAIELLDEVETVLGIQCAPVTWPVGMGKRLKGFTHLYQDTVYLYHLEKNAQKQEALQIKGLDNPKLDELIGDMAQELRDEIELVKGASHVFNLEDYLSGKMTPVYFGSAINNFGIKELLDDFASWAPGPIAREAQERMVYPKEENLTDLFLKFRQIWIQNIVIGLLF